MNKDYCFTFQQHDFLFEQTTNANKVLTDSPALEETTVSKYEAMPDEVLEETETTKKVTNKSSGYYFNAAATTTTANKEKLHLSLSTDKINLRSFKTTNAPKTTTTTTDTNTNDKATINKSIAAHVTTINRSALATNKPQQQQRNFGISFKIAPLAINNNNRDDVENLPEIVLTSFEKMSTAATTTTTKNAASASNINKKTNSVKFQGVHTTQQQQQQQQREVNNFATITRKTEATELNNAEIEENSELISLPGSSTSPESILDNVLSAASSVSVRSSSSLSSVGSDMTQLGVAQTDKSHSLNPPIVVVQHDDATPSLLTWPISKTKTTCNTDLSPMSRLSNTTQLTPTINTSLSSLRTQRSRTPSPSTSALLQATVDASIYTDELKCKICGQVYQDARTLNCLHSFCFQCLVNEHFKQDSSLMAAAYNSEFKDTQKSNGSNSSASPDMPIRSAADKATGLSFKRKKSQDKINLKSKSETKVNSINSLSSRAIQNAEESKLRYIYCKICKYATELPMAGLRQLPQNYMLQRKIEECRSKAKGDDVISRIWCNLCFEEISATYHCLTCNSNLCTLCKEAHERQRNTANHRIKNIMEARRAKKNRQNLVEDNTKLMLKCNLHTGLDIKAFCATCLQIGCVECMTLWHKNHKLENINRAVNHYARILRETAEQTRPLCTYAEHSIERLNAIAKGINAKCDQIQVEVEKFMQQYYEAVQVHHQTLLQQVNRAREAKVEMILEQQLDLEKRITEAMDVVRFTTELTDTASDVEILSFLSILLKRFEYCQQFKTPVDPKISDSLQFLSKIRAPSTKTQNDIPLYGIITMQTVEPALCTLQTEDLAQLRLHKKVDLTLISKDADNGTLCHGGQQVKALLKYKEQNAKFLPVEIADNRDGTYLISFTPDSQGTLLLTVSINDKPIKGSPFMLLARSVRPHNGIFHCCTFCSSKGSKLTKCACEGRMPGYIGCGHGHAGHPGRRHWSCCGNILENSECAVTNKLLNQ